MKIINQIQNPYTIKDFCTKTFFCVRSKGNYDKFITIYLENKACYEDRTEIVVVVYGHHKDYGRYGMTIDEVCSEINMKELLFEIANRFVSQKFNADDIYIEMRDGLIF